MKSRSAVLPAGVQAPRIRHAPPRTRTSSNSWEDISQLSASYGLELDEWQENVLEGAMVERADGLWAAKQVGVSCPRQNGKGAIIEARELAGLLLFGEQLIIHSAHEIRTSQMGFQRLKSFFENYDDLRRKVASIGNAVAREYIRLRSGQEVRFVTRSKSAIRGFSADCLLLDEGQILGDLAWEAILYTVSARTNHQIWLLGTPPLDPEIGVVFERFRARGLAGKDLRSCWFEWSAPPGTDLDDPQAWAAANPALGGRVAYDNVIAERAVASDEGFGRERLGMWADAETRQVFAMSAWQGLTTSDPATPSRVVLVADVSPDLGWGCIGVAGDVDGSTVVLCRSGRGTEWMPAGIQELVDAYDVAEVALCMNTQSRSLQPELTKAGIDYVKLSATDLGAACGAFRQAVKDGTVHHYGQGELDVAIANAKIRHVSSGEVQVWDRRDDGVDISPLVACSAAFYRWGMLTNQPYELLESVY